MGEGGIKCLWEDFQEFKKDMYAGFVDLYQPGKYISIDRIDSNGNYCKENCRWVTDPRVQRINCRRINILEINGLKQDLTSWLKHFNRHSGTYYGRVKLGMSPIDALTKPLFFRYSEKKALCDSAGSRLKIVAASKEGGND